MGFIASLFSSLKAEVEWLIASLAVATGNSDATADAQAADAASTPHHDDAAPASDITIPTLADQQADSATVDHHQIAPDSDAQNAGSDPQLAETAVHGPANLLLNADFLVDTTASLIDTTPHAPSAPLTPLSLPDNFPASDAVATVDLSAHQYQDFSPASAPAPDHSDSHWTLPNSGPGEFALASLAQQAYTFAKGSSGGGSTSNGGNYSHHDITSVGSGSTIILHLDNSLYDLSRTSPSLYNSISGDLQSVVNFISNHFNNKTVDSATDPANSFQMNVGWGEYSSTALSSGELGASKNFLYAVSYSLLQTGDGTNSGNFGFNGVVKAEIGFNSQPVNIPSSEPSGNPTFMITGQEIHALGITSLIGTGLHFGGIGFDSNPNDWFFGGNAASNPNGSDFMGIAIHEITEQLGRLTLNGANSEYTPLDLFQYSALNSTTHIYSGANGYFSVDGGNTDLQAADGTTYIQFNTTSTGDHGDWAISAPDAFDASPPKGVDLPFSYADYLAMEAIGFAGTYSGPWAPWG